MKLIIQIPCFNEAESLPVTLQGLPRVVDGFDAVEWLVVDDGSTDGTADIAKAHGVDHVVRHTKNRGLARAFMTGVHACLDLGADVIVNTDADNQYNADDIPRLTAPIVKGEADIVIGARPIDTIRHFSLSKRLLQKMGSWAVRKVSRTHVPDAPSGFRAFSREAAMRLNVFNDYTYTLETIIQGGQKDLAVVSVPIRVNGLLRPSRLVKSIPSYINKSIMTMVRIFVVYKPFPFFMSLGLSLFIAGTALGGRFLYFYCVGKGAGHVQSLILAAIFIGIGFQTIMTAFLADLMSVNRRLMEEIQYRLRRKDSDSDAPG